MLDNTLNYPTKFRTKCRWSLCDYSDSYLLVSGTIIVSGAGADDAAKRLDESHKGITCAPFTDCISEINITQIDNAKYIDVVVPMYNLVEFIDNYSKISGNF